MTKNHLKDILSDLQKGEAEATFLGDDASSCIVHEWVSTGCVILDQIMGGGIPVGRFVEIYGDTSTGKSLVAAQIAATAQEDGHVVVYIDTESAVSLPIMEAVGVDRDSLIYTSPDTVEVVFDIIERAIASKKKHSPDSVLVIIWDSIAATSANAEMEKETGGSPMAIHARIISQGLRKLARLVSKERICGVFINQTRTKLGVMFGDNEATFGGKATAFYSSIRLRLKLGQKIKYAGEVIGINTRGTVVKNKVAAPFRHAQFPIYFGHGIDEAESVLLWLKDKKLITTSGSWSTIGIGKDGVRFQKKSWEKVFDKHFDEIMEMIEGE